MNGRILLTAALGLMGVTIGYLAQRSRFCFVAGFRDYLLVRDRELLLGFFAFFVTVWVLSTVFFSAGLLKTGAPEYGASRGIASAGSVIPGAEGGGNGVRLRVFSSPPAADRFLFVTVAFGWVIGITSTFAGGCVLRQHVLAAQGGRDALFYLAGFYLAVVVYYVALDRAAGALY
jgi:uncharacterized membrane protein YedE/YeeE